MKWNPLPLEAPFKDPLFIDYMRGGWGINFAIAIDFTKSNGECTKRDSLHYLGPNNVYEDVINKVGGIL